MGVKNEKIVRITPITICFKRRKNPTSRLDFVSVIVPHETEKGILVVIL